VYIRPSPKTDVLVLSSFALIIYISYVYDQVGDFYRSATRRKLQWVCMSSVLVSGLRPSTAYKLIVYAENGVTLQSGTISASNVDVVTDVAGTTLSRFK